MTTTDIICDMLYKCIKREKRISQTELAKRMNVSPASVNKWITEGSISLERIPQLCEILGITPNELFGFYDKGITAKAINLYRAFEKYPEYQESVMKLLGLVLSDLEQEI